MEDDDDDNAAEASEDSDDDVDPTQVMFPSSFHKLPFSISWLSVLLSFVVVLVIMQTLFHLCSLLVLIYMSICTASVYIVLIILFMCTSSVI